MAWLRVGSVVLVLLLAGCAGGAKDGAPALSAAPQPEVSETTGAIRGSVMDDELQPIPHAQALVSEHGATATADSEGRFTISGLPDGAYVLFIGALGFESATRRVDVRAGEVTEVRVTLVGVPVVEAYHHPMVFDGYFECTWRGPVGHGPCFWSAADLSAYMPNQKRAFLYTVFPHMRTLIGELQWKTTSVATTQTLALYLSYANRSAAGSHFFGGIEGPSPVRQECSRTADEWLGCNGGEQGLAEKREVSEDKGLYMRHFVTTGRAQIGGQSPVGYGLSIQQPFKLYVNVFYGEPAPETFSGLPDQ